MPVGMARRCLVAQGRAGKVEFAPEEEGAERVRHISDEEGSRRSEGWKGGLERLLSRFERFEADTGLSAERWPSREGERSGGVVGETGSGSVRCRNATVEGGRYVLGMSGATNGTGCV